MANIGFYSGSFDPVTLGHTDIIKRATRIFDKVVIGVGIHHGKKTLFTSDERVGMLNVEAASISSEMSTPIEVVTFDDLVVDAALRSGANIIVRGIRDTTDFNYEAQMAGMNNAVRPEVDTIFLAASPEVRHVAATFVRQIAAMGGDVSSFIPQSVMQPLRDKLSAS